jgi:hypothetical protein
MELNIFRLGLAFLCIIRIRDWTLATRGHVAFKNVNCCYRCWRTEAWPSRRNRPV